MPVRDCATGPRNASAEHRNDGADRCVVLGIETSCDETAAAVVERGRRRAAARSCPTSCCRRSTSTPPSAAWCRRSPRAPMSRRWTASSRQALAEAGTTFAMLDGVAATAGPGLIGGLIVGLTTAKAIALVSRQAADRGQPSRRPCADRAADRRRRRFPICCCSSPAATPRSCGARRRRLQRCSAPPSTMRSARPSTRPPSCSACGYPGGPQVEKEAARGDAARFALPRPMQGRAEPDFSFSGLKTAVRLEAEKHRAAQRCSRRSRGRAEACPS